MSSIARGARRRGEESARQSRAMAELVRFGWGQDIPAFRKLFANLLIPGASEEQERWFADLTPITSRPEIAARLVEGYAERRDEAR